MECVSVQGEGEGKRVRVRESARGVRETCTKPTVYLRIASTSTPEGTPGK